MKELLENRKLLIISVGGIIFVLLYLVVFIFPTLNRITVLKEEEIPQKEQEVKEIKTLSEEYLSRKAKVNENLSIQNESIFSLVERIAKARGLSENISSIKPISSSAPVRHSAGGKEGNIQEVSVEVKMKDITLQKLVSYLYTLENSPYNLRIKEIQIEPEKDRLSLEVGFTASRWEKRE
jgi:predicted RND superfamily exporter protein